MDQLFMRLSFPIPTIGMKWACAIQKVLEGIFCCRGEDSDKKCFNDWRGRGYDDSVSGEVTKTTPSGIGLHDPLHGR